MAAERLGVTPRLAIRVNPPFALKGAGMKMGGRPSPFGLDALDLEAAMQLAEQNLAEGRERVAALRDGPDFAHGNGNLVGCKGHRQAAHLLDAFALHLGQALGDGGVVGRGHGALLGAKGLRCAPAHLGGGLGRHAAARGHGVDHRVDTALGGHHVGDGLRAHVALRPVAHAVVGAEGGAAVGAAAVQVVTEAQARAAVVLGFDHEVGVAGPAGEQVAPWAPGLAAAAWRRRRCCSGSPSAT